ncbi:MAG: hypothetical protein ABII80_03285 [bacterium]
MSPEAKDLLHCFEIEGYDPDKGEEQPKIEVEFPPGTINVDGAELVTQGRISYCGKAVVLSYLHPCCGAGGTIQEILSHTVGSDWVRDGDFSVLIEPNGGTKGKE